MSSEQGRCDARAPFPTRLVLFYAPRPRPRPRAAGADISTGTVATLEECCGACIAVSSCAASDFVAASRAKPTWRGDVTGGTCHLKAAFAPKHVPGENQTAAHVPGRGL